MRYLPRKLRRTILRKCLDRMTLAVYEYNIEEYGSSSGSKYMYGNPEDWDEIAYVMFCGLTGTKPKPLGEE